jgi:pimeloyl-ACP methyl ester carboxylesterase
VTPSTTTPGVLGHLVDGDGPPCLLLNGGLMSIRAWDAVAIPLATRFRVVRCDLRGQLLSPGAAPASIEAHADEVVRLLDALALDRVHVAGTSMGAFVAVVLAARHPDRARSVVAMTAAECITDDAWEAATVVIAAARAAAAGGDGGRVLDLLGPATFSDAFYERFAAQMAQRRAVIASLPGWWFEAVADMLTSLRGLDLRPHAARITCPALVIGAALDRTFPIAHSERLCAAFPHARLDIVPNAPHGMVVEHPAEVVARLGEFWSTIEDAR